MTADPSSEQPRPEPAAHAAWEQAALRALKGGALADVARHTDDGLPRGPLMTARDRPALDAADAPTRAAQPGGAWAWDIRASVSAGGAAAVNGAVLEALEGGATSVELIVDPNGADGVALRTRDDWARALRGVRLGIAPVSLSIPARADIRDAAAAAALLAAHLETRPAEDAPARAALNLDPLGALARTGESARGLDADLAEAAAWSAWAVGATHDVTALRADGRVIHDAGGSEAQELAWILACAAAYARAGRAAGLDASDALGQIVLATAVDADTHLGVAKLRALRRLWRRLAGAFGAAPPARIDAFGAARMLTVDDPWTNMIRTTTAGMAAALGGADSLTLPAWTEAGRDRWGPPSAPARRIARNQQLILREEAHLARVADPAAGSYHHEALTDALARTAWGGFQEIERAAGPGPALASGGLQTDIASMADGRAEAIATGARPIIGVTLHRDAAPRPVPPNDAPTSALASETAPAETPPTSGPADLLPRAAQGASWAALRPAPGMALRVTPLRLRRLAAPHENAAQPSQAED